MDSKHKKTEATNLLKNSIMTIIGLAIVGVGLWALMFYSTPPSNLEPYENYQESQKKSKAQITLSAGNINIQYNSKNLSKKPSPNF